MIKSSDPGLSNTYRIIRVLSNQDYLATDHNDHRFIFSQITLKSHPSIPASSFPQEALLAHREIIAIDNIQYAVFAIGTQEVVWAPLIRAKRLQRKGFIEKLMKQSCQGILKQLIWMGSGQANKYLDLKNFWLVGEDIRLLLVPRRDRPKFTIKKSQHRSLSSEKSIDQLMQAQKTLMKEFALLMWQICFQCSYYDDQCVIEHGRTRQVLRMMINRAYGYQELMKELSKQSFEGVYNKKMRQKPLVQPDLVPRRKTLSFITPNKSYCQTINNSRLVQASTEILKRTYHTLHKQQTISGSIVVANDQMRTSSAESTILHNASSRKSRYFSKRQYTQSSSKETVHFERWLQSKRYSVQTRQKLIRNGELARKKYSQAIEYSKRQTNGSLGGREQKLDDSGFKAKILSKVIRFKNAMKDKKAIIPTIPQEDSSKRQAQSSLEIGGVQRKQDLSIELRERKEVEAPPKQVQTSRNQAQTLRFQSLPPIKQPIVQSSQQNRKEVHQNRRITNDFIHSPPQDPSSASSLKTQKKKQNRINIVSATNTVEDIQEVELNQSKVFKPLPKKKQNAPVPPPMPPKIVQKTVEPAQGLNQLVLMVNTLGDMTVRAIKRKEQLSEINVRQATYFLYERFQYERTIIQGKMSQGISVCRQHRRIQQREWSAYLSSEQRQRTVVQMGRENQQITSTLQRLGQKLLQEETVERKIEYFIKNRVKVLEKSESGLRKQLSRFLISSLVSEFDYAWEEQLQSQPVVHFLNDCCFGAYVVAELDAVIPPQRFVRLDQYKEYRTLHQLKPAFDFIDAAYFPKESS